MAPEKDKMLLSEKNFLFFIAEITHWHLPLRWMTVSLQKVNFTGMTGCALVSTKFLVYKINELIWSRQGVNIAFL